jgi:hypothetical protein
MSASARADRVPARTLPLHRAIPALALAVFALLGLHLALTSPFPGNDELEHVSYAAWLREEGRVLPRYEEMVTLRRTDLSRWDWRPNYVGHPSPYYLAMAPLIDRARPPAEGVRAARLASLLMLVAAAALALSTARRLLAHDAAALAVACAAIALCPQLVALSAMVTNDALAVLGGALALWGLAPAERRAGHDVAAGAGLALALWAKANAGIEVGAAIAAVLLLRRAGRPRLLLCAALGGALGLAAIVPILIRYGQVVPVTAEAIWEVASIPDPAAYLATFLPNLLNNFGYQRVGAWPLNEASAPALVLAVAALLGAAGWGAWAAWRRLGVALPIAGVAAAVVVLPVHAGFAATRLGGSLPAASFRYDLPIWPALAIGAGYAVALAPGRARAAAIVVAAAALLLGYLPI